MTWAATAKRRHDWDQSAIIMTILANAHRNAKRSRVVRITDFLPADLARGLKRASGMRLTTKNLHLLKPLFEKQHGQPQGH